MLGKGNTTIASGQRTWAYLYVVEESATSSLVHGVLYPWGDGVFPLTARGSVGNEPRCATFSEWELGLPELLGRGSEAGNLYVVARCKTLDSPLSKDAFWGLGIRENPNAPAHNRWLSTVLTERRLAEDSREQWVPYLWRIRDEAPIGELHVWDVNDSALDAMRRSTFPQFPEAIPAVVGYTFARCGRTGEAWWVRADAASSMPPARELQFDPVKAAAGESGSLVERVLTGHAAAFDGAAGRLAVASCVYYRVSKLSSAG